MTVDHFNDWYAAMDDTSRRDQIWQRLLGLPAELVSTSLLSMSCLREAQEEGEFVLTTLHNASGLTMRPSGKPAPAQAAQPKQRAPDV